MYSIFQSAHKSGVLFFNTFLNVLILHSSNNLKNM